MRTIASEFFNAQRDRANSQEVCMITILMVLLVLFLVGAVPAWPHSREWGYYPSGLIGTILIILVIMMMLGRF